jgi:hypothetical protein
MVMFKAKFKPASDKAGASDQRGAGDKPRAGQQQQQQPQPVPVPPEANQDQDKEQDKAPPIEKERGPQYPVKEPGPSGPPARA